jgi:type I restriction enzyme S subunit
MRVTPVRLGDILQIERIPVEVDLEENYVQIGVRSFGRGIFHRDPIPGMELGKLRYFEIHPGRLIVSNIMAWEGAVALSSDQDEGCVGSNRFLSYMPTADVDLAYLNYFFQGEMGRRLISRTSTGTVVRNQTLSMADFEDLIVPLPDPSEQHRIAAVLDQSVDYIRKVLDSRDRIRALRVGILNSYLRDLPRQPLGVGLSLSNEEMHVLPEQTYNICGVYGFGRGIFGRGGIKGDETSYTKLHRLRENLLVMSRLKAFEGALAVVPAVFDGWFVSPEFPTFEVDQSRLNLNYLSHLCAWGSFWRSLSDGSKGLGARRERVSAARLLEVRVPFPEIDVQREIAKVLDRLADARNLADHQQSVLGALRPSLLNAAFAGQL